MSADTIHIELSDPELHVLTDLLDEYIQPRVWEAVQFAHNSLELERAAERVKRLAEAKDMAWEGTLPRAHLGEHIADFMAWLLEAEQTAEEHEKHIADEAEDESRPHEERESTMKGLRGTIVVDYAHKKVCERIVAQLQEAREQVPA